jgi:hypothetical protein
MTRQRLNPDGLFWKLLAKAERKILEKARAEHGTKAHEFLGIAQGVFYKRAKRLGVSLEQTGGLSELRRFQRGNPPKGSSPSSSAARLASALSAPSGSVSRPRGEAPGGSLSWLMNAAKSK